jgi:hypothetical protein
MTKSLIYLSPFSDNSPSSHVSALHKPAIVAAAKDGL